MAHLSPEEIRRYREDGWVKPAWRLPQPMPTAAPQTTVSCAPAAQYPTYLFPAHAAMKS